MVQLGGQLLSANSRAVAGEQGIQGWLSPKMEDALTQFLPLQRDVVHKTIANARWLGRLYRGLETK